MLKYILRLLGWLLWGTSKPTFTGKRSGKWPALRRAHLAREPLCRVCGGNQDCTPHHIVPVHIDPDRELDPNNLITLCEGKPINCHLLFGHLKDWKSFNANVVEDCRVWADKLKKRP